jgi:pSer/pThr/pTyr-binding forkhead associated (FHA) protein
MMSKLTLQFDGVVLKECAVATVVTIGRLPDNTVIIENPAVSGHHARVVREGDAVILEDLESTNGTFVNQKHVTRHTLQHGDVVLIGKHKLVFEDGEAAEAETPATVALKNMGDTVYLDTKKHRELLATLRDARATAEQATRTRPTTTTAAVALTPSVGVLKVLAGRAEKTEYRLEAQTSLIGSSHGTTVRLLGWFKPGVAVAIARSGAAYVVTPMGGKTLVNNQRLRDRYQLKNGDIMQVGGLTLEFRAEEAMAVTARPPAAAPQNAAAPQKASA